MVRWSETDGDEPRHQCFLHGIKERVFARNSGHEWTPECSAVKARERARVEQGLNMDKKKPGRRGGMGEGGRDRTNLSARGSVRDEVTHVVASAAGAGGRGRGTSMDV